MDVRVDLPHVVKVSVGDGLLRGQLPVFSGKILNIMSTTERENPNNMKAPCKSLKL